MKYKLRRKILSQNFLYSLKLTKLLVDNSSIDQNDIVLEIGAGKGLITTELCKKAQKVIALELDEKLFLHLKQFLGNNLNLNLHQIDFLKFPLPKFPYKVFANIPFSIEGEIIRKLLDSNNPPEDCYLIVDKRLASRLSGLPHENQFSLKHKPWFNFSIFYQFKRSDFTPSPSIDSVMWQINKKEVPLLPIEERSSWEKFIEIGFGQGTTVNKNLLKLLSKEQLQNLSAKINFSLKTKSGYLSFPQWLKIYKALRTSEDV
ncbi:MAG: rRNA adenine N(6)-methyltransferase family protein [Candidatus Daviesbacteria bacterium]|nr:rRNA adenine N(6)-methyltransferase family protein [Candidatus Daviesbacteria bacterium]